MDALEAAERIAELREKVTSISRIVYYVDDSDFRYEKEILNNIKNEIQTELEELEGKLRAVQL